MKLPKLILVISLLALSVTIFAEGSREVAPNGNIVISGTETTDIAALLIDNAEYNSFASYTNPDPNSRLYIHIIDPTNECVFLGFSFGHSNATSMNPPRLQFEYRVRDPNGNVVFGPIVVPTTGGNILSWSQATTGPASIYGAGGYDPVQVSASDLTSQGWSGEGDYFIEFDYAGSGSGLLIDFWDISVADCSAPVLEERKGRVWSYNWAFFAINDFGFPVRPFNGAFYVCAPDPDNVDAAFITKIDFNGSGFSPAAFNIAFNSFGSMHTGNVMVDRRSVENANSTQSEYAVFLNDPVELCETAETGDSELLGVTRCGEEDYCIKFIASEEGQIDLLLDFDGPDDLYTPGTADVMLAILVTADQVGVPSCINWDGRDGLGNLLNEDIATAIPVVISFAQGIYHFPIYDAEFMINGVVIEAVRPPAPPPLLYYDDSNISVASGSGEPSVQLSGCAAPCHRWTFFGDPNIPGFGNLNTINTWWFSQRIERSEVFFLPAYLVCDIVGPQSICENDVETLTLEPTVAPVGGAMPEMVSVEWSGPEIVGSTTGSTITIGGGGVYTVDIIWLTPLGDSCSTSCEIVVETDPVTYGSIDTLILSGTSVDINGEIYDEAGQFTQILEGSNGCDSILTVNVFVLQTVVHFSLDDCASFPSQGTDSLYTEFTPEYPEPISCAGIEATLAHRERAFVNTHSCTPGVNDSPGICISSLDDCEYDPGNEKSFVFEITVTPAADTAVAITGLTFWERGPEMFDWIGGATGPNNYPTLYGVRVLKDGVEIFSVADVATTTDWTLESYDFLGVEGFITDVEATYRFEFLGYCLVGNGAMVPAWDLDEISVVAGCVSPSMQNGIVSGRVLTEFNRTVSNVEIGLDREQSFANQLTCMSSANGEYEFRNIPPSAKYFLRGYKNTDFLEGVSTLDLIRIQKHLLGLREFDSPLQWLAADVNGTHTVSVLDLVDLRKLILGRITEFHGNTSWRFGDPRQELTLSNPWEFSEVMAVSSSELTPNNTNFLAVKIGDVNGSITNTLTNVDDRASKAVQFVASDQQVLPGQQIRIPVRSTDHIDLGGFQCSMMVEDGRILRLENGLLNLDEAYAIDNSGHALRMSWFSTNPVVAGADDVLFTIVIESTFSGALSDLLRLDPTILEPEAYLGTDEQVARLAFGISAPPTAEGVNILYQNTPNPFSGHTEIRFALAKSQSASLRIFSLSGTLIYEITGDYAQGLNTVSIPAATAGLARGVYVYQLQCDEFMDSKRMIVLD